jgi:hypothetical protein
LYKFGYVMPGHRFRPLFWLISNLDFRYVR